MEGKRQLDGENWQKTSNKRVAKYDWIILANVLCNFNIHLFAQRNARLSCTLKFRNGCQVYGYNLLLHVQINKDSVAANTSTSIRMSWCQAHAEFGFSLIAKYTYDIRYTTQRNDFISFEAAVGFTAGFSGLKALKGITEALIYVYNHMGWNACVRGTVQ